MAHRTYIRHVEDADIVVLFIHGFLGSPNHFERFVHSVPKNVAIYNILLNGHGGSVLDFANTSMKCWKRQIDDTVNELAEKYKKIIIVAHSMGTLFAMEAAIKYQGIVKSLFLLQASLKISVKPKAVINTLKLFFNLFTNDEIGRNYKNSHSITLNKRLWEYIGWIPRCLELFEESRRGRNIILRLNTPCHIFLSAKDELVTIKSLYLIPDKPNISISVLKNSQHFIYSDEDFLYMMDEFCRLFE